MAVNTRLPRLLDANRQERARLRPTASSLQLQLNATSTAQMTLPHSATLPAMHDWVELYTAKGSAGLYRVTAMAQQAQLECTVTLMHGIDTLSDCVWVGQTDYSGTVAGFLQQLLAHQKQVYWQLGTCQDAGAWKKSGINYDRISDLLADLIGERHGYYLTYDFSTWPWTLNLLALPQTVSAEWRLGRNVHTCTYNRNDNDLCTRLYLSVSTTTTSSVPGYTPEELDGRTVPEIETSTVKTTETNVRTYDNAAAQAVYGIVEKTADINTEDVVDPNAWAQQFLQDRAEPTVQITIDGYELAALTGDSWDDFTLGKLTRCCLVNDGITVHERVVGVTYSDIQGEPTHVVVELANRLAKFSESIATAQKSASAASATATKASRGGGSSTKDMEHWAMVVQKAVEALDGTGLTDLWETGIELDAQTGARLYSMYQGMSSSLAELRVQNDQISTLVTKTGINDLGQAETLYTKITQNESSITSEVARATGAETVIGSRITQTETDITSIVSKTGVDNLDADETLYSKISQTAGEISTEVTERQNADSALSSRITQNANSISLVVSNGSISAASIVAAINNAGSSVTISADHVDLEGYVTVSKLTGKGASVYGLLAADDGHYYGALTVDGTADVGDLSVNGLGFFYHKHELSASESSGVITITEGDITSGDVSVNFNIADTQFYKDAVSAAKASGRNQIDAVLSGSATQPAQGRNMGEATGGWYYQAETSYSGTDAYDRKYSGYVYVPKYTEITVTPIGDPRYLKSERITPIGTKHTPTKRTGTLLGSPVTITPIGAQETVYPISGTALHLSYYGNTTLYLKRNNEYVAAGGAARSWYYVNSGGTTYWQSGSAKTYYKAGTPAVYYNSGSAFEYYDVATSKDLYEAGTDLARYHLLTSSSGATDTFYAKGSDKTYYKKET